MFPDIFNFAVSKVAPIVFLFFSAVVSAFLYWRTAKRELVENQTVFDTAMLFFLGGFVGGRIVDFFVRPDYYGWSLKKLIFFNAFWGFDALGGLIGGFIIVFLYLRNKKDNFWDIFDYASEGIAFGLFLIFSFLALQALFSPDSSFIFKLIAAGSFLVIFWIHKRLAKQKRHRGFFSCFFLLTLSLINAGLVLINQPSDFSSIIWPLSFSAVIFIFSATNWYMLAKRKIVADVKTFSGFVLLLALKIIRTMTNVREADSTAKLIILFPLNIAKMLVNLVKYLMREIYMSFVDVAHAFGLKK